MINVEIALEILFKTSVLILASAMVYWGGNIILEEDVEEDIE